MKLQEQLAHTLERTPANLQALSEFIDPLWISQALQASGSASIRRRKLPAEQVVWLVIGLALFRNQSIASVARQLNLSLGEGPCVPSAAVQGRQRLGDVALEHLFNQLTGAWGAQASGSDGPVGPEGPYRPEAPDECGGLRVLAVDGVVWSAPDTQLNRQALGCCSNQHGSGSWPQIRAVCLMDTSSHELLQAQIGAMAQGEVTLAAALAPVPNSLTVFDRAYFSAAFLLDWHRPGQNTHWLLRARDNLRHEVLASLGPGDSLIRMPVSQQARKLHPHLPETWQARLITVQFAGQRRRFITSLCDARRYPGAMLAALYRQRWEIELGFRELKQSLQAGALVLRSKQPELVRQEIWGTLIAYTLLRRQMRLMASHAGVPASRIGFHGAAAAIIDVLRFAPLEAAANLPRRLALLFEQAHLFVLPPRRQRCAYPRVVKPRPSKYPVRKKNASQA